MSERSPEYNIHKETQEVSQSEEWQQLQKSFSQLHQIPDETQREYELIQAAKRFELSPDLYRRLFERYDNKAAAGETRGFSDIWRSFITAIEKIVDLLSRLGWILILWVAIALTFQTLQLHQQQSYLAWLIVSLNQGQVANAGRILALERLNADKATLAGLNVEKALLPKIDLEGAQLYRSNLKETQLYQANLSDANLGDSNFSGSEMYQANLSGAVLSRVNFQGADLGEVNLKKADLAGAKLKGTNLIGADLRETQNLEKASLVGAVYGENTRFPVGFNPRDRGAYLLAPGVDLSGVNLSGASLVDANLENANLEAANLQGANLFEVKLKNANLLGANLKQAKGMSPTQIKAAKNWEQAIYDREFRQALDEAIASESPELEVKKPPEKAALGQKSKTRG